MVLDPAGKHAYVANQRDNTISLLNVDTTTGSLTEVLPRTSVNGFPPDQLLLDSAGTTLLRRAFFPTAFRHLPSVPVAH